ncbi:cation-translocating P-type ATPase [Nocardioides gansuensis]|uniref:cation-translocating P-type ATPase n=1 Tax=Nocardioides gansuensis TaxID=2138300 RepID=UPI0010580F5D|nr:cation-translocating P-type ATPase [Nocardioides gansuensis]
MRLPRPPSLASIGAALASVRGASSVLVGRSRRRAWVNGGRAHVQVLGVDGPDGAKLARALEERLAALDGVHAAAVNGVLGRVVVDFDDDQLSVEALVQVIEEEERQAGLVPEDVGQSWPHPGDVESLIVPVAAVAADVTALGLSLAGRALRVPPIPVAVPWLVSLVESSPKAHDWLVAGLGARTAGLGTALTGAGTMGLAQGEAGLLADVARRLSEFTEAQAWQAAWLQREPQLADAQSVAPIARQPRPAPLPVGPVEQYARLASWTTLALSGLALAATRSPSRAFGLLLAGTSTAARVGREVFAAQLGQGLAKRGVVAVDPAALRRLDRIDVTVLDSSVLVTGRHLIREVRALDARADPVELYVRAHELVDPASAHSSRSQDGWAVHRVRGRTREPAGKPVRDGSALPSRASATLLMTRNGRRVGIVTVVPELDPLAEELVTTARNTGEVVLANATSHLGKRLSVDEVVPGGRRLAASIRALQQAGRGVVLVSRTGDEALTAADCGIGVLGPSSATPWGAHLLCGPGLTEVCQLLDAVPAARTASRRSATLALVGSAFGALLVFTGPARGSARRAMVAVHGATLFSVAAGTWSAATLVRRPTPVPRDPTSWHVLSAAATLERLRSAPEGLTEQEARARLAARAATDGHGQATPGITRATMEELANPLTPTLSMAAGASAVSGAMVDAVLIGTVLGVNALIGGAQRVGADRAMHRLVDTTAVRVRLRRDGAPTQAKARDLVPGDVIELQAGDAVPADCRVLAATGLEVDESSLTGESLPVLKSAQPSVATALADRHSMLHEGTAIAAGHGRAVVVATGGATELGRTARAAARTSRPGGVEARLRSLTRTTIPISVGAGVALVGAGLLWRRPLYGSLATAISLAVAAVPEGLPFVATVAQLGAAGRLSHRNALVRQPATIEALGRVDTLCFDKTGTLTEGRIRLRAVSNGRTDQRTASLTPSFRTILGAALRATPHQNTPHPVAHPTDEAVLEGAARCRVEPSTGLAGWELAAELPFEPARGYHATLGRCPTGSRITVKGAPEVVVPRCTTWLRDREIVEFDGDAHREVAAEIDRLARSGYRVLAVADRPASGRTDFTEARLTRLCFLGLLALADPVRPSAAEAVRTLHTAGVDVVMVTGDHPSTAEAIAAELGLLDGRGIMTGPELDELDDLSLAGALAETVVFARTSPMHKVRIVELMRRDGRVVAVTGDGANDAPAIRTADVGIAMGLRGTNATKQAADLVITDDRIETITDAVVEGRALWASVRDALAVMIGGNIAEIAFTLGTGVATRSGSALNARQLLLVNLLTDVLPAMAIAGQRPPNVSPDELLHEGPDVSLGTALSREIWIRATVTTIAATTAWAMGRATGTRSHAATVALVALVGAQLGQTLLVGRRSPLVIAASLASIAALVVSVQTPGIAHFFGNRPLGPIGWTLGLTPAAAAMLAAAIATRIRTAAAPGAEHAERPGPTGHAGATAAGLIPEAAKAR